MPNLTILIVGGYGTFGGRLVELLADKPGLTLVVAGRSRDKAEAFCRKTRKMATLVPDIFDRNGDLDESLHRLKPDMLVDATGPFQIYGDDPYRLVKACLRNKVNYLDFADGSAFARDIAQFDEAAKAQGIFILSAVSSFPVLTAAVVRHLSRGIALIEHIEAGIAPSPYAGVGPSVIRAIASYAGKPVDLLRDGQKAIAYGLTESRRFTICPPGKLPLHSRRFSLVDVPDLQLIPEIVPGLSSIWMGAAPVPEIFLRALNGLARLVRMGLLPGLVPLASIFNFVINHFRWGEHRGGMYVQISGRDDHARSVGRSWHLLAEGSDGPLIPSMAIAIIIRKALEGIRLAPGARAATEALELEDYSILFAGKTIHTGIRNDIDNPRLTLYRQLLGDAWDRLAPPVRSLHDLATSKHFKGMASVERGQGLLASLAARIFGFPKAGSNIQVEVNLERSGQTEIWTRNFAGKCFFSRQSLGAGNSRYLIDEHFGPFSVGMAVVEENGGLHYIVRRGQFLGLPLPAFLAPGGQAFEHTENGRFHFHAEISHPWLGLIVRYRGWLDELQAIEGFGAFDEAASKKSASAS